MAAIGSVAVLLHERDRGALGIPYRIWALCAQWRRRGIRVELLFGVARETSADLLIPHLDLSYVPDAYWAFIQGHPNVVNRHLRDIRKTAVSTNLLAQDDTWPGPVIVKTNNNCRGSLERRLLGEPRLWTTLAAIRQMVAGRWIERKMLGRVRSLRHYHVFRAVRDVPVSVWTNTALVVERFLPQVVDGVYTVNCYTFFGNREQGRTFTSRDPMVKVSNAVKKPRVPPPPAIVAARRSLSIDYAKMDYVIHDGQTVLLDVNPTPSMGGPIDEDRIERSAHLADGLLDFVCP